MNKNQNHRNKLPLILAALLTLALVAYGTFACFTDTATQNAGLQLTLGNVDIKTNPTKWKYESVTEANNQLQDAEGSLIEPGKEVFSVEGIVVR
ncbi:SipW-dependent-type signal peptide-containing protein [Atopococcus tabaci]|uniref:SipW-dependent-type signal peptide-containing protein n=1 Tax=Atopococcus tabaci TaxID=269774 RepID=UPI002409D76C|nr:SipW-dependent-type signal peptide-containing protein [Atopococcus tabaci]